MKTICNSSVIFTLLLALGCAGTPRPTDQLARTEAALRAAAEVGAGDVPRAQLHHTLAKEQLEKAREQIEQGDNERASATLERAKADAELALALAREHQAEKAAAEAEAELSAAEQKPASAATHARTTHTN